VTGRLYTVANDNAISNSIVAHNDNCCFLNLMVSVLYLQRFGLWHDPNSNLMEGLDINGLQIVLHSVLFCLSAVVFR